LIDLLVAHKSLNLTHVHNLILTILNLIIGKESVLFNFNTAFFLGHS